jgi:hypothetical protein
MTEPEHQFGIRLSRRGFVAGSGAALAISSTGALTLPIALPLSAHAVPLPVTDWSIDDMWTGYPRPWEPISPSCATELPVAQRARSADIVTLPGSIEALFA